MINFIFKGGFIIMLTVLDLAKNLNISTQAIYKKINKSMKDELAPHIKEIDGQRFIDDEGVEIIKNGLQLGLQPNANKVANRPASLQPMGIKRDYLSKHKVKRFATRFATTKKMVANQSNNNDNKTINMLQDTLKTLTAQLEVKDRQISDLNERLKEAQELNRNNQLLLGGEQSRTNPALLRNSESFEEKPINKKGFWNLFKKE